MLVIDIWIVELKTNRPISRFPYNWWIQSCRTWLYANQRLKQYVSNRVIITWRFFFVNFNSFLLQKKRQEVNLVALYYRNHLFFVWFDWTFICITPIKNWLIYIEFKVDDKSIKKTKQSIFNFKPPTKFFFIL